MKIYETNRYLVVKKKTFTWKQTFKKKKKIVSFHQESLPKDNLQKSQLNDKNGITI